MDKDILAEDKDAFSLCVDAESEQRNRMLDDLRFARLGQQWPDKIKRDREADGRPCLTVNRLPSFIRQVVNDARQNKPSVKVHPVDSGADVETAKILDGLIRNIEYTSSADVAYDTAIDHAASMGVGYWRIGIDYARDDSFDLDLRINRVANPFTVYGDPHSTQADSSDWNDAFVTELLPKERFKSQYPDAEEASWASERSDTKDLLWVEGELIRVAERWERREVQKNLLLLSDGTTMLEDDFLAVDPTAGLSARDIAQAQGIGVVNERQTKGYEIKQRIITSAEVLEENAWPGVYIPIVPVYGEEINEEGRRYFLSLIHQAKDAQRMFNFWRTMTTELVALAPKAPWLGKAGSFDSDPRWATANIKSHQTLEYDGDVAPQRQPFAGIPAGALQEAMNASDDMKSILGLYDASLGARSNETSGRAIMARKQQGDISTFHFADNQTRAIRHTGRILLDLIPHVYSAERVVRVIGEDGIPQPVTINTQTADPLTGVMRRIHDVSMGKYDITISSGPSFNTRREEAAYQMTEFVRAYPDAAPIIGDILVKNLDWPGAEEIAERLKAVNPVLQKQENAEQPPPPDPRMEKVQADTQLKQQQMQIDQQQAAEKLALEKYKIDANIQADLAKQTMQIKADMESQMRDMEARIVQTVIAAASRQKPERMEDTE